MTFKIKNWKLAFVSLIFFCLFVSLGLWQLSRAQQKKQLLAAYHARMQHLPLNASDLKAKNDLRFFRVQLEGEFDNAHTFLLDNKTFHGQIGYEIYTPFNVNNSTLTILVDRGFIPLTSRDRHVLPTIQPATSHRVSGLINLPPQYATLGGLLDTPAGQWPARVEYIAPTQLEKLLTYSLYPYIVTLTPQHADAFAVEWQIVTMPPERHLGYAAQWFAFALTLLILFVALNCRK